MPFGAGKRHLSRGDNHNHFDKAWFVTRSGVLDAQCFDVDPMLTEVVRQHRLGSTPDRWINVKSTPSRRRKKSVSHELDSSFQKVDDMG